MLLRYLDIQVKCRYEVWVIVCVYYGAYVGVELCNGNGHKTWKRGCGASGAREIECDKSPYDRSALKCGICSVTKNDANLKRETKSEN